MSNHQVSNFADPGFIYILNVYSKYGALNRAGALDFYKIGKTTDFERRYAQIKTEYDRQPCLPFRVGGAWGFECWLQDMNSIESFLHKKYAARRLEGEWFNFTLDEYKQEFGRTILDVPWPTIEMRCWCPECVTSIERSCPGRYHELIAMGSC